MLNRIWKTAAAIVNYSSRLLCALSAWGWAGLRVYTSSSTHAKVLLLYGLALAPWPCGCAVHLLLTYGLARGVPHAVVGSNHPPGSRLVPYLGALRWPCWIKPADGSPCCSSSRSSVDNALLDLLAGGLCAPAKSRTRDSTPTHLVWTERMAGAVVGRLMGGRLGGLPKGCLRGGGTSDLQACRTRRLTSSSETPPDLISPTGSI